MVVKVLYDNKVPFTPSILKRERREKVDGGGGVTREPSVHTLWWKYHTMTKWPSTLSIPKRERKEKVDGGGWRCFTMT